jgi:hypothetical protein
MEALHAAMHLETRKREKTAARGHAGFRMEALHAAMHHAASELTSAALTPHLGLCDTSDTPYKRKRRE